MATRKGKHPGAESTEAHAFTVVLEEIRAQNKAFGEGQELLRDQMRASFEEVDRRFEQVDRRFEQIDHRFEQMDQRFERIEQDVGLVKIAVLDHARELKEIRTALDRKVDRDEVEAIVARAMR
jgi:archaellum component FlaC